MKLFKVFIMALAALIAYMLIPAMFVIIALFMLFMNTKFKRVIYIETIKLLRR